MRPIITLALLLALIEPATASYEPARHAARPDIELPIGPGDIFIEMINTASPIIPYSLKLWRFQKLLSTIMLGTKAPTWDINVPRSLKDLKFNADMLQELNPGGDVEKTICVLCNSPTTEDRQ